MLLLVDGSNLLFQMFYGIPPRIVSGRPVQGTVGFVGALLKIIGMVQPTHVAVLFDGECSNERRELDADYKANRQDFSQMPQEQTPFSQLPDIYAALDEMNICHGETTTCEADDWLAGYALRYGEEMPVVISSQDSDLFQLITENVRILRYRGEKTLLCDEAYVKEKLGIAPSQYADFKALVGDPSDHIRGVEKIGVKTAAELLARFGSLDAIISRIDEIEKTAVRESLSRNTERARHNLKLIKLSAGERLPFELQQLSFLNQGWKTGQIIGKIGVK